MTLLPPEASVWAADHDTVFLGVLLVTGFFFLLVAIPLSIALVRGRRARPEPAPSARTQRRFEVAWTALPIIVGLALFAWGADRYLALGRPPADATPIMVVGKRWMWRFYHPGGRAEINDLHVPAGRPVRLVMTSDDVIHSLYLPAFRHKQDVLPGRYTSMWFEATAPGDYLLLCSEYCGTEHADMMGRLIVMPPEDYDRWAQGAADQTSTVERGARLYAKHGCATCHAPGAAVAAPPLEGIWQQPVELEGGRTTLADEDYLRRSLLTPAADVVAGHAPLMPSYQGRLSEDDIIALIALIRSWRDLEVSPPPDQGIIDGIDDTPAPDAGVMP
ncbi:MAG: cytochrome c oxidase subunit II [bacterium]